jgi:hypothetical protein
VALALTCATKYRLPEPTRIAHRLAGSVLASSKAGRLSDGI